MNLQQIPSSNKEIRMMFKASDGYVLVGSDYSQQEPRLLTAYSEDEKLLDAYNNGKDMYATMGMGVYNNDYWDNMEHYPEGTVLELDGKKTVAGSDKSYKKQVTDRLEVPYYYLIPTVNGSVPASDIKARDKITADEGAFEVASIEDLEGIINIYFVN